MTDQSEMLAREVAYWKAVSAYLATCHAATAEYLGNLKSTSKSERERLRSISRNAAELLRGQWVVTTSANSQSLAFDHVIQRCRDAGKDHP